MEDILMTIKEANRLQLLKNHADGIISLSESSKLLGISYRHTKRLWKSFKIDGEKSLVSKKPSVYKPRRPEKTVLH